MSEWQLQLPSNPSKDEPTQFDYETISDVIVHVRYTAREGGALLRQAAIDNLKTLISEAKAVGSVRLFSIRNEFRTAWDKFKSQEPDTNERYALKIGLRAEHYPFWIQSSLKTVKGIDLIACSNATEDIEVFDQADTSAETPIASLTQEESLFCGKFTETALPSSPVTELNLFFDDNELEDLWIAITFGEE
jgi:hypothetical protein